MAAVVGTVFVLLVALPEKRRVSSPEVAFEGFPEPQVEAPEVEEPTSLPPRALAITGRVLRNGLEPATGAVVVVGGETVTTDRAGRFEFAVALRPRRVRVRVLSGPEPDAAPLAEWDDVVAGDFVGERRPDGSAVLVSPEDRDVPSQPRRIRWTVHVGLGKVEREEPSPWLRIDAGLVEEWGNGAGLRLRGNTKFPDGAKLDGSLYHENLRFLSSFRSAVVAAGRFDVRISCTEETPFYSAPYDVRVNYNQILQAREYRDSLDPADETLALLQEATDRVLLFAGSPREAALEDGEARKYFSELLDELQALDGELTATVNDLRLLSQNWDPALLKARQAARSTWFEPQFLDDGGRFDETAWRHFLDVSWRPRVLDLLIRHRGRGLGKYPETTRFADEAVDALWRLSFILSSFLIYPMFGLPPNPNDDFEVEEGLGDRFLHRKQVERGTYELGRFREILDKHALNRPPE